MPEHHLDQPDVDTGLQHVGRERVPQRVKPNAVAADPGGADRLAEPVLKVPPTDVAFAGAAGEQPRSLGPSLAIVPPQLGQESRRQDGQPILVALAVPYAEDTAVAVDVADLQSADLRDPQARGVGAQQPGPLDGARRRPEHGDDLGRAEDRREWIADLGPRDPLDLLGPAQRHSEQEPDRRQRHLVGVDRGLPGLDQVVQVCPHIGLAEVGDGLAVLRFDELAGVTQVLLACGYRLPRKTQVRFHASVDAVHRCLLRPGETRGNGPGRRSPTTSTRRSARRPTGSEPAKRLCPTVR